MTYIICFLLGLAGMFLGLCIFAALMRRRRKKQKMEMSKRIFWVVSIATGGISVFTCYMVWLTRDLTPLAYLIPAAFAELAVGTAFYYDKSKAENKIKLPYFLQEQAQQQEQPYPPQ